MYDYSVGRKAPPKPFMVDVFRQTFELQERARRKNQSKVRELLGKVERLEKESWDRVGAVEDVGGAR